MAEGTMSLYTILVVFLAVPRQGTAGVLYQHDVSRAVTQGVDQSLSVDLGKDPIPVFGKKYNRIKVSTNGFVIFGDGPTQWQRITWKDQQGDQFTQGLDPVFLAPYYARTEPGKLSGKGTVYFESLEDTKMNAIRADLRNSVTADSIYNFQPKTGFMVTWLDLTFNGGGPFATASNTFQAAIVTDGQSTYSIFNYENTSWTGGVSAGGDATTGLGAKVPPAQAGFNLGNGRGWVSLPYSGTERMVDLDQAWGGNMKGRFVYSIGGTTANRGSCTPKDSQDKTLILSRSKGSVYGGEDLYVSGPCQSEPDSPRCRFGDETVIGFTISATKIRCVPPKFFVKDGVSVELSLDGGKSWTYKSEYDVYYGMSSVKLDDMGKWATVDPKTLSVSWKPEEIVCPKLNIWLVGYKEVRGVPSLKRLKQLGTAGVYNRRFSFDVPKHQSKSKEDDSYELGVIEVACSSDSTTNPRRMHSKIIPLGWYMNSRLTNDEGGDWPSKKCRDFYERDGKDTKWLGSLASCPCTLSQARADLGRWEADPSCNEETGSECFYHKGARHCVRSVVPARSGAGNQCCYRGDGSLMHTVDSTQGSTPDRGYYSGAAPFRLGPRVPGYSHWLEDVIPYYYCCLWSKGICDLYMERRPTRDCVNYASPRAAVAYGDPHFTTFDNFTYTFNGKGEFWLTKSDSLWVQGRFEEPQLNQSPVSISATALTSVVFSSPSQEFDTVEFKLNPASMRWSKVISVIRNGKTESGFSGGSARRFGGVSVLLTRKHERQNNFTVRFDNGVGAKVIALNSFLQVLVVVPPRFKTETEGLFGSWDDDAANDLKARNGQLISNTSSEYLYKHFGMTWQVTSPESKFFYTISQNHDTFNDTTFEPYFGMPPHPNISMSEAEVNEMCHGNKECIFDYRATGNEDVAKTTLYAAQQFRNMMTVMTTEYQSCGALQVRHAKKDSYYNFVGAKVKITGCEQGYVLSGDTEYQCIKDADGRVSWNRKVTADCKLATTPETEASSGGLTGGQQAGIAIGVILILAVIAVVLVYIFVIRKRQTQQKQAGSSDPEKAPPAKDNDGFEEVPLDKTEATKQGPPAMSYRYATADKPTEEKVQTQQAKSYRYATADTAGEEDVSPKKSKKLGLGPLKFFGSKKAPASTNDETAKENEGYQSEEGLDKPKKSKTRLFKKKSESSPEKATPAKEESEEKKDEEQEKRRGSAGSRSSKSSSDGEEKSPEVTTAPDKPSEDSVECTNA